MVYFFIKEVAEHCDPDDIIIVTSSLTKDMNSSEDLYRANSIRVLVDDGAALHFTSFEHRDEALALIKKVAGGSRGPLE